MISVVVQVSVNSAVPMRDETLIIEKVATLSQGNAAPNLGRWTSHSRYLGRTMSGNYMLRNWNLENFGPGVSLADPVALFLDSPDMQNPFLLLSNFDTGDGIGKLYVRDPDVPEQTKEYVHWTMWR